MSADPLPDGVAQLAFKAIQTYSNGDIVRWIDLPQAGQPAPEHPAPVLALTPASAAPATAHRPGTAPNATGGRQQCDGHLAGPGRPRGRAAGPGHRAGRLAAVPPSRRDGARQGVPGKAAPGKATKDADREASNR